MAGLLRGDPDAQVGGPAVASADSFLVEGLIAHCATQRVPLHFISWHLYSDSPAAHAANVAKERVRLAKFPQLQHVKLFISEWNMDLMRPNLAPGFQPCFVLETMRRYAEAKLDSAAPVNYLKVLHFGRSDDLANVSLQLQPWDIRWIEIE